MSNNLQKRLYDHEVPPPAGAWDKIAATLDESHLSEQFPSTLYNLEAAPPATAWEKIAAALDGKEQEIAPVRRMFSRVLRYVAAAAIIAAVVFTGIKLITTNKPEENLAEEKITPATEEAIQPANPEIATVSPEQPVDAAQEARDDAALEASKHMFASLDAGDKQRIKRVSEAHFLSMADPISAADNISPDNTYRDLLCADVSSPSFNLNDDNSPIDIANRYIMLLTPDGHFIRISKKLGPLVCCVSGEEQDEDCSNQLKKWKEKLANSSTGTSSGSFLEILNLINSFKDNNPQ